MGGLTAVDWCVGQLGQFQLPHMGLVSQDVTVVPRGVPAGRVVRMPVDPALYPRFI